MACWKSSSRRRRRKSAAAAGSTSARRAVRRNRAGRRSSRGRKGSDPDSRDSSRQNLRRNSRGTVNAVAVTARLEDNGPAPAGPLSVQYVAFLLMRILVTNDDGVRSEGIHALAAALGRRGEVTIVAPHAEASAIGHALTLRRPLRVEQVGTRVYEVDGTPTDCVNIGIAKILGSAPDLIASGINKGYNLGDDVTYSGTVAGALEGALLGIPSIAVSLERSLDVYDFGPSAAAAAQIAESVLRSGLAPRSF